MAYNKEPNVGGEFMDLDPREKKNLRTLILYLTSGDSSPVQ